MYWLDRYAIVMTKYLLGELKTRQAIAEASGLSHSKISQILTNQAGHTSLDTIQRLEIAVDEHLTKEEKI